MRKKEKKIIHTHIDRLKRIESQGPWTASQQENFTQTGSSLLGLFTINQKASSARAPSPPPPASLGHIGGPEPRQTPAPSTSSLEDEFVLASRLETHESPGVLLALISEMRHPSRSSFARCLPRDHFLSLGHRSPAGEDRKKNFPFYSAPQYPGDVINMAEATRLCIKASLLLPMQLITHHKHLKHGKHSGTQIQTDTQTQARTQNEPRLLGQQSNTVHPDSWFSRASTLAGAGRKKEGRRNGDGKGS